MAAHSDLKGREPLARGAGGEATGSRVRTASVETDSEVARRTKEP